MKLSMLIRNPAFTIAKNSRFANRIGSKMGFSSWRPFSPLNSLMITSPWRRTPFYVDPFENVLDRFFDDTLDVQLRDHAAQLKVNEQGNMTYKVDVSGFRPGELNVEVQGNEIVVRGEHREQNQGESVHRQFIRRVLIPDGIKKESIKCELDKSGGRLCIFAKSQHEPNAARPIPIDVKKGEETTKSEQQQKNK